MTGQDTIFAPSTGTAAAAVSVIRLSGPGAFSAIERLTGVPVPAPRLMALRSILAADGMVLDRALVVVFAEGASFTGEAMAEIQCHGGRAVVGAILEALAALPGCRIAEPGEFSKRALLNGRIGLTEAEGLADLIAAETRLQHVQAMSAMSGALGAMAERWRTQLVRARALVEVTIDWADEEVPEDVSPEVREILTSLAEAFSVELGRADRAEKLRHGIEIAIIGPPNAGKSSLLNAIAGREAAIVSAEAGTTRDVLEIRYDLDGLLVVFLDTAGLRDAADAVEAEGVARAAKRASAAELRLHLRSADTGVGQGADALWQAGDIAVWSKADLGAGPGDIAISVADRTTIDALLDLVKGNLDGRLFGEGLLGHQRQKQAVAQAHEAVLACLAGISERDVEELAEELRFAIAALDRLTGRLDVEDVLDMVFGAFCLGK